MAPSRMIGWSWAIASLLVFISACGDSTSNHSANEPVAVLGFQSGPDSLSPLHFRTSRAESILGELIDFTLLRHDPIKSQTVPWLAENLPEADAKQGAWIWTLPADARRGDGQLVSAFDAVTTVKFLRANGDLGGELLASISHLVSIKALDARRFATQFDNPHSETALGFGRIFHLLPDSVLSRESSPASSHWGSGPYELMEHDNSQSVFRKRNNWWGQHRARFRNRFSCTRIRYRYIRDQVTMARLLKEGVLHLSGLPSSRQGNQVERPGLVIENVPTGALSYVIWNSRRPPFDRVAVRKYLDQSLPRDWILKRFTPGTAESISVPFGAGSDSGSRAKPRDLSELADFQKIDGSTRFRSEPFRIQILVPVGAGWAAQASSVWAESLRQNGIDVVVEPLTVQALLPRLQSGDFGACLLIWRGQKARMTLRGMLHSDEIITGGRNFTGLANPGLDAAIEALESAAEGPELRAAQAELDLQLESLVPVSFLFRHQARVGIRRDIIDIDLGPQGLDITTLRFR